MCSPIAGPKEGSSLTLIFQIMFSKNSFLTSIPQGKGDRFLKLNFLLTNMFCKKCSHFSPLCSGSDKDPMLLWGELCLRRLPLGLLSVSQLPGPQHCCVSFSQVSRLFFFFFNTYPEGLASQRMITQRDECRKGLETQTTIHFAGEVRISHKEKIKKENPWFFSVIH